MLHKILLYAIVIAGFCNGDIFEINKSLGKGANLGNMYESPDMNWGKKFEPGYMN